MRCQAWVFLLPVMSLDLELAQFHQSREEQHVALATFSARGPRAALHVVQAQATRDPALNHLHPKQGVLSTVPPPHLSCHHPTAQLVTCPPSGHVPGSSFINQSGDEQLNEAAEMVLLKAGREASLMRPFLVSIGKNTYIHPKKNKSLQTAETGHLYFVILWQKVDYNAAVSAVEQHEEHIKDHTYNRTPVFSSLCSVDALQLSLLGTQCPNTPRWTSLFAFFFPALKFWEQEQGKSCCLKAQMKGRANSSMLICKYLHQWDSHQVVHTEDSFSSQFLSLFFNTIVRANTVMFIQSVWKGYLWNPTDIAECSQML